MLKLLIVVCAFVALASGTPIQSHVKITAASSLARNPIQALAKAENCGYAVVHDIRLTGTECSTAPCTLTRGNSYRLEADFTTRGEACNPFFRSILVHGSDFEVLQDNLYLAPDIRLSANTRYTFTYDFTLPPSGFKGEKAELRLKVFENMVAQLCLAIPATIV